MKTLAKDIPVNTATAVPNNKFGIFAVHSYPVSFTLLPNTSRKNVIANLKGVLTHVTQTIKSFSTGFAMLGAHMGDISLELKKETGLLAEWDCDLELKSVNAHCLGAATNRQGKKCLCAFISNTGVILTLKIKHSNSLPLITGAISNDSWIDAFSTRELRSILDNIAEWGMNCINDHRNAIGKIEDNPLIKQAAAQKTAKMPK